MPGNEMRKIRKAITLNVDCICMDMEDAVAQSAKELARATISEALTQLDFKRSERLVRINPVGSGLETADLETVLPANPDGIVIPKVNHADQVHWVSESISKVESKFSFPDASIRLMVIIESAQAIINLREIASADPRLVALIFGADDYAADIGATRSSSANEVLFARGAIVAHAAAFNLQAIDLVNINLEDIPGLIQEAQEGARMGYSGKQVIHPRQVDPVQEAFSPSSESIDQAQSLIQAYNTHQEAGIGVFVFEDKMIDAPTIKAAQRVLSLARAAGKL